MELKGFERLQSAIQWVADEERLRKQGINGALAHNQGEWAMGKPTDEVVATDGAFEYVTVCATSCCVAGNVVIQNGDKIITGKGTGNTAFRCLTSDGEIMSIRKRATELLGISEGDARALFDGGNQPWTLYAQGKILATKHGHTLEVL